MKRVAVSFILSVWVLFWLWAIGQFQWSSAIRAAAFFIYFSASVFILDKGYQWIRPSTDWSIRSGLLLIMFMSFIWMTIGHSALSELHILTTPYTPVFESNLKHTPLFWSIAVGILHALIIGIMGMTVLIWRRPS